MNAITKPVPLWRSHLITGAKNKSPKAVLANVMIALREAPEWQGVLAFDTFAQRPVLLKPPPWSQGDIKPGRWTSEHDIRATEWIQREGINVGVKVAVEAIEAISREHTFHPVRDYLKGLRWDQKSRLDRWAVDYLDAKDDGYTCAVAPRWMISAVARVMEPGCKADCALILEGIQGALKSTALKILADPWFTDELADVGSKDAAMQTAGVWILELSELESIHGREVSRIKAFLSRRTDRYRPPYALRVGEFPRQCVFAGTTNREDYQHDPTGGRRFWPIVCGTVNIEALTRDRDQLWAEAYARYNNGERWWLDTEPLNTAATEVQEERKPPDPWLQPISDYVHTLISTTPAEILTKVIKLDLGKQTQKEVNRVVECLKRLRWKRKQVSSGPLRGKWHYVRPSPVSPDAPV